MIVLRNKKFSADRNMPNIKYSRTLEEGAELLPQAATKIKKTLLSTDRLGTSGQSTSRQFEALCRVQPGKAMLGGVGLAVPGGGLPAVVGTVASDSVEDAIDKKIQSRPKRNQGGTVLDQFARDRLARKKRKRRKNLRNLHADFEDRDKIKEYMRLNDVSKKEARTSLENLSLIRVKNKGPIKTFLARNKKRILKPV